MTSLAAITPAPAHAAAGGGLATAAVVLIVVGVLLLVACAVWGVARALAWEPRWSLALRHAIAEAGFRASATWREFGDWARLGR
ncbi:MAG TPA: hypothetical protein VLZ06_08450 [Solirubrobacteraceae bacterium]|nr:hypothetical protein [Solirubrobacteraceae bacterium]